MADGTFTHIDIPGAIFTDAFGINNAGEIVGQFRDASGSDGFLLSRGEITRIRVPGALVTAALGINDHGDIVGLFTSTFAVYQDPVTGQRMECETNQIVTGMGGFGGPGQSPYADCKTTLEERGYKRVDTRYGDYQKPGSAEPQPVTSTK